MTKIANQLINPSFEEEWDDWDASRQIPYGWDVWWADDGSDDNPHDPNVWSEFCAPEIVHTLTDHLPPSEQALLILDGDATLKIFLESHAWFAGLSQKVYLEPALYEFKVNVFADLVKSYDNTGKVWADDPQGRDGLLRFKFNSHGYDYLSLRPGEWNTLQLEFAADGMTEIGVDIMCPFALKQNGVFCDAWSLYKVSGGGRYYLDHHTIILPGDAPREHAHELVDVMYDELANA